MSPPNVTSETRIQSQFRGLSKTSPGTIRDAEENQHGAIVASTALEQIMRLSIGIGLCEPWQPPAWMDFVVLEMGIIIPSVWKFLFATAIFSREANSSTTFQTLESIPFVNEFVSNDSQPSEPILRQLSPPTHQNYQSQASHHRLQTLSIAVPSTTPSPTNPFHYLSSHVHSTLLLNGPFNFQILFQSIPPL